MAFRQTPKAGSGDKREDKADITHIPAHLLCELYAYLDKNDPLTALSSLALVDKNFAESIREANSINLIDFIDLLQTVYQIPKENLPLIPDNPKAAFKIYCDLLLEHQEKLKSAISDFMDQGTNINAYLEAPDISRQYKHLQNIVENELPGFQAIRIFLNSLKKFKESPLYKELTLESVLMKAITTSHLDGMMKLLERKANINARDKEGNTPLILATKQNNLELIKFLMSRKADVALANMNGDTALMHAINSGHLRAVEMLTEKKGPEINVQNAKQQSALTLAVKHKHKDIVNFLLLLKADPNVISEGSSLLSIAVQNNDLGIAQILLHQRLNPNATIPGTSGRTLIMEAARLGNQPLMELLMDYKADIFTKDADGYNALMLAGDENVARALLERGMINVINDSAKNGSTALIEAIKKNHMSLFNILLTNGANPNAALHDGTTALMLAAFRHWFILQSLVDFNANVNAQDKQGRTALMRYASQDDHIAHSEHIEILLESKSDPNVTDKNGLTALMLLCQKPIYDIKMAQYLIDAKADLKAKDRHNLTPFMHLILNSKYYTLAGENLKFAQCYSPECLKLFANQDEIEMAFKIALIDNNIPIIKNLLSLNFKFDINSRFTSDPLLNPLSLATQFGNVETVKFLLEQKADPNAANINNRSALMIAVAPKCNKNFDIFGDDKENSFAITKLLLESKADANIKTKNIGTPIIAAAVNGYVDTIKLLLAYQADLSEKRQDGLTVMEIVQKRAEDIKSIMTDNKSPESSRNRFEERNVNDLVNFLNEYSKKPSAEQEAVLSSFKKLQL